VKPEWILPEPDLQDIAAISESTGIDKNIISILQSRGVVQKDDILSFLFPELNNLHSPFLLHGIYEAVSRLKKAITSSEKVAIFGDSDLDGITSLTIIHSVLSKAGCKPVIRYPKAKESYGLTCDIIDEFIKEKITLVITVDSGIRDIDEIKYGRENGIDFIVTDHHEPDEVLPDAVIINPKQSECSYPFKELAGVGVAFKFVQAFLYSYTSGFNQRFILIYKEGFSYTLAHIKDSIIEMEQSADKDSIVVLMTSTITPADYIVLLNDESLTLSSIIKSMHHGIIITDLKKIAESITNKQFDDNGQMLDILSKEFRIITGNSTSQFRLYLKLFLELQLRSSSKINAVLQEYLVLVTVGTIADIMPLYSENRQLVKYGLSLINSGRGHSGILTLAGKNHTTSKSISWNIAPLLNAPGRMGETGMTVNFFLEQNNDKISEIISAIQKVNDDRKKLVNEIIERIRDDDSKALVNDNIFFYMHDDIIDGLAGLIANRIADDIKKPVIIATGSGSNGIVKGSARSSGNFDFFKYTAAAVHLFERVGGHAQAFGFTAEKDKIKEIAGIINNAISDNFIPEKTLHVDSVIELRDINSDFIKSISLLEPFGKCNEEPLFLVKNITIGGFSIFGNTGTHGKYQINGNIQAIGWNMFEKMSIFYKSKKNVDIVFRLENNEYLGKINPRMIVVDIDFSE
jgi:single-stranded-DNA-specific exonuclease